MRAHGLRHQDDHVGDDVGDDHVRLLLHVLQQVARHAANHALEAVDAHVLGGDAHGHAVDVDGQHVLCAHVSRGDGEDAGAGAHVDGGASGLHVLLHQLHAHAGGLVGAGAEGHAGIDLDHLVARFNGAIAPAGLDEHVLAQSQGLEGLLPVLRPVLLGEGLLEDLQLARVEAQIQALHASDLALDHAHAVVERSVHLVVAGDLHVVADALGDGLIDDVPLALGALVRCHVVLILDHGAAAARVHQNLRDQIRARSGGEHRNFHPIHVFSTSLHTNAAKEILRCTHYNILAG